MKKIIIIILLFGFCKIHSQTQWNKVSTPNDTVSAHYNSLLNVIDSLTVLITPRYTYDSQKIIKTIDGGISWNSYTIDSTLLTIIHETEFVDKNVGYMIGGTDFGNWNVLLKTNDGGINWMNIDNSFFPTSSLTRVTEISFVNDKTGFIARNGENKIYRTTNGGTTFTALDLPQIPNGAYSYLTEMRFISPYVGFVSRMHTSDHINSTSQILKTIDGGTTWTILDTNNWQNVSVWEKKDKIQFVNDLQGFAIVGTGILKTTQNGGNSWTEYNVPLTTPPPTDFYFVNNACGYLALAGNIYRTNDAGQTWSLQTIENNLNRVHYIQFATESFGYALNEEPKLQGQTASKLLNTNQQPAASLSFTTFEDDNSLSIYPIPADDIIYIKNKNNVNINFVHILDSSGKIVKTFKDNVQQLNISSLSSGNYLLFIQTSKQKTVKKIIIK